MSAQAALDQLSLDDQKSVFAELSIVMPASNNARPTDIYLAVASNALCDAANSLDDDEIWETTELCRKKDFRDWLQGYRNAIDSLSDSLVTARLNV